MNKPLFVAFLAGIQILGVSSLPALAVDIPVLTLTEQDDQHLDWSWSDGTGSGTFVTVVHDFWNGVTIPLLSGISDGFYGRWAENDPGYRNDVFLASTAPGSGTLYVTSDLVDFSPTLAALGTALNSDHKLFQIIFNDRGDHFATPAPDSGATCLMLLGALGSMAFLRRRKDAC